MELKKIIFAQHTQKDIGLLWFRVLASLSIMKAHGIPKIMAFSETVEHIADPLGLGGTFSAFFAVFANVICAGLVAIGLATRWAALTIMTLTLNGLLLIHFRDSAAIQDVPLIYTIVFGFISFVGAGKYSLDHKLFNN